MLFRSYSELCDCYLVQLSIHTVIAQHISCYSELCDCYSVQFSIHTVIAQHIWCYSELCDCYSVQLSIHTVIAQPIWCYSELCDCYSVQLSIHTVIARLILCYSELCDGYSVQLSICTAFAQLSWSYSKFYDCYSVHFFIILLLLNAFGVKINFMTVIQFSSNYIMFLTNTTFVAVNCLAFSIQFSFHMSIAPVNSPYRTTCLKRTLPLPLFTDSHIFLIEITRSVFDISTLLYLLPPTL